MTNIVFWIINSKEIGKGTLNQPLVENFAKKNYNQKQL